MIKTTYSLNGAWRFRQADSAQHQWHAATIPGCVHTDLINSGQIPDPYDRDNEHDLQWIGEVDWVYERAFYVPPSVLAQPNLLLRCAGLDTLATIVINGREIGRTDNQFRTWEFDVKSQLHAGENTITICFDSALKYGQARLAERYIHSWSTDDHKLAGGNYLRKAQCNFGWDWGPQLITCGIWRDIELIGYANGRFADLHILQDHAAADTITLTCKTSIERHTDQPLYAQYQLHLGEQTVAAQVVPVVEAEAIATIDIADPHLWWPNGMGAQPLYMVTATLLDESQQPLDVWQRQIGLRTLQLVRQPDQWGESFHFACNGVSFFAKGANWIPADTFIGRITDDWYADLLQSTADANMNMLRVWGGGIYEQPAFYELCDALGICVWQDFMFACATYPTDEAAFVANIKVEAAENIRRLRHHASLALWCGNNELEQGLVQDSWTDTGMSWADYSRVFDELLPQLVAELDPQTDYWPGSPHTPYEDRRNWNDPRWGDAHIWDVWHGMQPFEFYYGCFHRFNSEFGFQSFPEPQTIRAFTRPEDRNITSYVMEHHQRSPAGNSKIMHYMLDWFQLPNSFEMTVWLSQILQGMAIKYAVEHWRRTMPRGMGTLYWQLNDCWPVASWSSLDHGGRWKALHHMARQFFAPLMLSSVPNWESGAVELHVTCDRLDPVDGVVRWSVTTAQGEPISDGVQSAEILPNQNTHVTTVDLSAELAQHSGRDLLVWLALEVGGAVVSRNLALFIRPKHLRLASPNIKWELVEQADNYIVTLTADKPALWVWLEIEGARADLSDNFFHLRPNMPYQVTIRQQTSQRDTDALRTAMTVHSLYDTFATE